MTAAQNHAEPIATAKTATAENDLAPRSVPSFSLSILLHAAYACLLRALHAAAYIPPFAGLLPRSTLPGDQPLFARFHAIIAATS